MSLRSNSQAETPSPGAVADVALRNIASRCPEWSPPKRRILEEVCARLWSSRADVLVEQLLPQRGTGEDSKQPAEATQSEEPQRLLRVDLSHVDLMTGRDFERFLGEAFEYKGYEVRYDAGPAEAGGDLVCWERNGGRRHAVLVQAKRELGLTDTKAIGQILRKEKSFKYEYPTATYDLWVISSSHFTLQAKTEANRGNIRLLDREALEDWLVEDKLANPD